MKAKTEYIPSPKHFKEYTIFKKHPSVFMPKDAVSIDKIKIDKKYLSFPNPVRQEEVDYIVNDFCLDGWEPIMINQDNFLLDGQHRIEAAKRMGLEYIDVIIEDNEKLKN